MCEACETLKLWGERAIARIVTFQVLDCDNHIEGIKGFETVGFNNSSG